MRSNISVGIDVGSTKIVTCIGKSEEGKTDIIGLGKSPNFGIRKGIIVDVEETVSAISASLDAAEKMAGVPIQVATVGISGPHIELEEAKGVIAVTRADGEISEVDVARAIDASKSILNRPNREILHVLPTNFIIDGHEEIKNPVGMTGIRLEVLTKIISSSTNATKSLARSVDQAGLQISNIVFSPLGTAQFLLSKRQTDIGVVLADLGASTTTYVVFEEGDLVHCGVIPIGTMHITNDIAIGLRTNIDLAEIFKLKYGHALPDKIDEKDEVDLSKIDKNESGTANVKYVAEIIEARLNELFMIIKENLANINRDGALPAGIVLTGGGAKIEDVVELTKDTLCLPAQVGRPAIEITGLIDKLDDPVYACGIGLMLWDKNKSGGEGTFGFDVNGIGGFVEKFRSIIKNFLP